MNPAEECRERLPFMALFGSGTQDFSTRDIPVSYAKPCRMSTEDDFTENV